MYRKSVTQNANQIHAFIPSKKKTSSRYSHLAGKTELGLSVRSHSTPSSLDLSISISTDRVWLPWFVKGLKVKYVSTPIESGADTLLPEGFGICIGRDSNILIGRSTVTWPAGFTSPELDGVDGAGDVLDAGKSLGHVVEVDVRGVVDLSTLPVGEAVCQAGNMCQSRISKVVQLEYPQDIDTSLDYGIGSTVLVLVPTVCGTNLHALGQDRLDIIDLLKELLPSEVSTVKRLRADRDGINLSLVLRGILLNSSLVCLEGLFRVGPYTEDDLESLALGRWENLLGAVAAAGRVDADQSTSGGGFDGVKIGLVIGGDFAGSAGGLVT